MNIWKSKRFIAGLLYVVIVVSASFIYSLYIKDTLPEPMKLLYSKEGKLLDASPFSPLQYPPLGSDWFGEPILYKMIEGAKFTIGFALLIAALRLMFGMLFGTILSLCAPKLKTAVKAGYEVFYYIPTIFLAYVLITPVFYVIQTNSDSAQPNVALMVYQLLVVVFLVVPAITIYVSDEIDEFMKQEFMISARLLGANRFHLLRTHLLVLMRDRLILLFMQHVVQVLILLTHLGMLKLFIGGLQMKEMDIGELRPVSLSNEWSGLIGIGYNELNFAPWIVLGPLLAFAVTIFFLNLMTAGLKDTLHHRSSPRTSQVVHIEHTPPPSEDHLFLPADSNIPRSS